MLDGKRRLGAATALLLVLVVLLACTDPVPAPTVAPPIEPPTAQATAVPMAAPTPTAAPAIKVGALFDLSGTTSEVSRPYVDAVRRYVQTLNDEGGIDGRKIELVEVDYGYQVPKAVDAYKKLIGQDKVVAILGWSTADTEALAPLVGQDKVPYLSASYAASLVESTTSHPYNFLLGTTYSDQMRVLLKYVDDHWQEKDRKPKIAFLFADNAFGRAPLPAGREMVARLDFEIADEQALPFDTLDATGQLNSIQAKGADYVIVNNLTPATAVAVQDAAKLGLKARILTLNWAVDEELVKRAGPAADTLVGASPFTLLSEDKPGFAELKAAYQAKGVDPATLTVRHVQGWLTAKMMLEGIRRAKDKVTGESIKQALETIEEYDTGGITAPITWTKDDHAGNKHVKLYQVQNGRWAPLTDFVEVER